MPFPEPARGLVIFIRIFDIGNTKSAGRNRLKARGQKLAAANFVSNTRNIAARI